MPLPEINKKSDEYRDYVFSSQIATTSSLRMEDPGKYNNLQKYLHFLRTDGVEGTKDPRNAHDASNLYSRAWNILAARTAFDVEEGNKSKLSAQSLQKDRKEMQFRIRQTYGELLNSPVTKEFFRNTRPPEMLKLLSHKGHGGELERAFRKFLRTYPGPIPADAPPRYAPTAIERIETLQEELKGLSEKDPGYRLRAKEICMEIAATRAAVNCTPGNKSTLKHPYDLAEMNRSYQALKKSMQYMDPKAVDKMVSNALKGHGGAMEQDIKAAVLNDMQRNNRIPDANVPVRYQANAVRTVIKTAQMSEKPAPEKKGTELRKEMAGKLNAEAQQLGMGRDANGKPIDTAEGLRRMRELFNTQMAITHAYIKSIDKNTRMVNEQEYARQLSGSNFQRNLEQVRQDKQYQNMMDKVISEQSQKYSGNDLLSSLSQTVKEPEKLQSLYLTELEAQKNIEKQHSPERGKEMTEEKEQMTAHI